MLRGQVLGLEAPLLFLILRLADCLLEFLLAFDAQPVAAARLLRTNLLDALVSVGALRFLADSLSEFFGIFYQAAKVLCGPAGGGGG